MAKFIEVETSRGDRCFLNVNYIEQVVECGDDRCVIYMAFNVPEAVEQDYIKLSKPYDEVIAMIKEVVSNA